MFVENVSATATIVANPEFGTQLLRWLHRKKTPPFGGVVLAQHTRKRHSGIWPFTGALPMPVKKALQRFRARLISTLVLAGSAIAAPAHAEIPSWPTADSLDTLYETGDTEELVAAGVLASIGAGVSQHATEDFFIEALQREPTHVLAAHALLAHCARKANVPICGNSDYLREAVRNAEANGGMWLAYAAATHRYAGADAALPVVRRAGETDAYESYFFAYMDLFNRLLRVHAPLLPTHHQQLLIGFSRASVVETRVYGICQSETEPEWTAACRKLGRQIEKGSSMPTTILLGQSLQMSMLQREGDADNAQLIEQRRDELARSLQTPDPSEYFHERDPFWYELAETQINLGELAGAKLIRDRVADAAPIERWPHPVSNDALVEQVAEGIAVAARVRARVERYIVAKGRAPAHRESVGLERDPEVHHGEHVSGVDIVDGQIIVHYGHHADERLQGLTLVMTPYVSDAMSLSWQCGFAPPPAGLVPIGAANRSSTVPPDYMPAMCVP